MFEPEDSLPIMDNSLHFYFAFYKLYKTGSEMNFIHFFCCAWTMKADLSDFLKNQNRASFLIPNPQQPPDC
ncbi:hypothetical protein DHL47_08120 [Streptococcus panodentis]|uniref:Uncharacterized protein n=1 Tax=Streptococcus panodentis TaxID=1581472 RepID=A0ABS5AYE1_9STRE|nr:hypothetical protein STRDD11_01944 [Streptococcus sp. DD11]MBP2621281.1 hypothetical protein [Streptococcus panodentis]